MNKISVLDCTLRDGGYCNNWQFGYDNIKKIIKGLIEADIDIIECGYLTSESGIGNDISKYADVSDISKALPDNYQDKMFVAMMNWDEYDVLNLPHCSRNMIDGIRVAFHKKDLQEGLKVCDSIQKKGYKVFVQAMVSLDYTDKEFLELLENVNIIHPYAFYIVDSFGVMKKKNLMHMLYMVDKNLLEDIWIGFHSHNNLQLAYANAQCLTDMPMKRNLIIDSSIFGMGRGAGNLNTELFIDYLNENHDKKYDIKPLLSIIDEIISKFYGENPWGYTLPNYLSAIYNIHPNYAMVLDAKKTLTVKEINEIFSTFDKEKSTSFDHKYIEDKYIEFLGKKENETNKDSLHELFAGKTVLLIGPGISSIEEKDKIIKCAADDNVITIGINFNYLELETDFIFLSNLRRYRDIDKKVLEKCIVTSNIPADNVYMKVKYKELLNEEEYVQDNALLLVINLLIKFNVKEILLAGIDGYSVDESDNYAYKKMIVYRKKEILEQMNIGVQKVIDDYSKIVKIKFLTKQKYILMDSNGEN